MFGGHLDAKSKMAAKIASWICGISGVKIMGFFFGGGGGVGGGGVEVSSWCQIQDGRQK